MTKPNEGGPDATMDGRTPILPEPVKAPEGVDQAQFTAAINDAVRQNAEQLRAQFSADGEKAAKAAERDGAVATMRRMIDGNPGDDTESLKFRGAVQDLVFACMQSDDKPPAEFVTDAVKLNQARLQVLLAKGGDGGEVVPTLSPGTDAAPRHFMSEFMGDLASHVMKNGDIDGDELKGSETFEHVQELMERAPGAKERFAQVQGSAKDSSRVIPFPLAALFEPAPDARFAETYAEGIVNDKERRERTYRRDALVDYFRPSNVLALLGAPMPMIDNDLTLPRLADSMAAAWYAENAEIADDDLDVVTIKTTPHRLGVHDSLSWMLLAGGDAQFGHQPLVVSEMAAAVMQAKESAVYNGSATGSDPTGIRNASGVTSTPLGDTLPTWADLLAALKRITDHNIPVSDARWAINWTMATLLWQIRRFATGSATLLEQASFMAPGAGAMNDGNYGSVAGMMPGGKMAAVTNHLPVATSGITPMICGVWPYVWCLDYSTAYLTIDDISAARNGRTLITVNSYHDVAVRFTDAFEVVTHDTIP